MAVPLLLLLGLVAADSAFGQTKPRARDLGIPLDGTTGQFNAITDVAGVEVGYTTIVSGQGKLVRSEERRVGKECRL